MFVAGYAAGIATLVLTCGAIGWYAARHPRFMVRKMMGRK